MTCFSTNIIYCISCRLIVHKRQVLILDLLLPSCWWLANTENNKKCWESFISDCLFLSSIRNAFRNGLIQGDKLVIYPILQWLFENLPELKKRAYLARYLVKVEIPPDQLADQELYELHESVRLSVSCLLQFAFMPFADFIPRHQLIDMCLQYRFSLWSMGHFCFGSSQKHSVLLNLDLFLSPS